MNERNEDIDCFYFPPELWTENILPRLPVKTLLIFRSVCKSWCSAIDDPTFISMHFKLSNNNCNKNKLLAIEKTRLDCTRRLDCIRSATVCHRDTFRRSVCVPISRDRYLFQNTCNGLFLVRDVDGNLKVCNLSIRKSLLLPPCPLVAPSRFLKYLFGFKPSSNDYVVHAFFSEKGWPVQNLSFAVYTLSDNLWRIRNFKMALPSWIDLPVDEIMSGCKSVCVDGAIHWFGNDDDDVHPWKTHLVSFNFDTEKFNYIELPDTKQGIVTQTFRFLSVLGGSLATLSISSRSSSIWVLKNNSWDLRLVNFSNAVGFQYLCQNTHVISNCFYVEDGGITLAYGQVVYKIMRDERKYISTPFNCFVHFDAYVESLVLHKGCPGEILTCV